MAAHISILYDSFRLSKLSTYGQAIEDASMIQPRMRSPTGSLTYYSSIVAIINQHHISSSRSFRPTREAKRKKWKKTSIRRSIESFADANEIQLLILDPCARACVCVCVCVRSTRNHQDICTCVRSWTTTKDTRVKTGTKFTLVDTFSATKSRRLRFRGSPPNPNTIGQGMEVLTQEMRSSGVISLRRDGASVVDSEDVSLARSKPFKFPVRVVERWYVVARVRGCDVLVMYFRSIEIWIDRPRSASSDRYDFSFRHCSFACSQ